MEGVNSLTVILFIFLIVFLPNVHCSARYADDSVQFASRPEMLPSVPIYYETYQNCRNQICTNTDDYPEAEIISIMRNTKNMQGMFGIVLNSTFDVTQIVSRANFPVIPKKLCSLDSSDQTFTPRVMRNGWGVWKYIVNVENYYQRFTAEICRSRKEPEKRSSGDSCTDFGFKCRQNYQEVYLLTYERGVIDFDKFLIPTTCNCVCDL
nr:spaetzle-5 protein [Altica viridicyanea]